MLQHGYFLVSISHLIIELYVLLQHDILKGISHLNMRSAIPHTEVTWMAHLFKGPFKWEASPSIYAVWILET